MYKITKFSIALSAVLTLFCAGLTVQGFGANLETYIQAGATVFLAAMFFIRLSWYRTQNSRDDYQGEQIPDGPITRNMTDPFSQTMWQAFDSGKPVFYNAGDDHMTTTDEEGNSTKVKLK